MGLSAGGQSSTDILEKIFEASTLEEAVYWRAAMVGRLRAARDAGLANGSASDFLQAYSRAIAKHGTALAFLRRALHVNARVVWVPRQRHWTWLTR